MSDQAAAASPAPAAGDGGESPQEQASGGNPFAGVLEAVPHGREAVEAALKDVEGKITQRFEAAADFRKQWEPYAAIDGLQDVSPEQMPGVMALHQLFQDPSKAAEIVSDPEAFGAVWEALGESLGYFDEEQPGAGAPEAQTTADEPPEWAQGLLDRLDQIEARDQERTESETATQAEARVNAEMQALVDEHTLDDAAKTAVLKLAHGYAVAGHEDAIAKGFADFQEIRAASERGVITEKGEQPAPAVTPASADTSPTSPNSFRDAREIAERRLAAAP